MRGCRAVLALAVAGMLWSGLAEAGTVYVANEISNTVSVIDTATNRVTATIPTGDDNPHRPLYNGIIDAHGANLSPDGRLLAVTGRGSSNVLFIDTATNRVVADVLVGREPHVPTFTPDGREAWVTIRGRDHVAVVDTKTFHVTRHIKTMNGPSMLWFSPDGRRGYIASQKEAVLWMVDIPTLRLITVAVAGHFSPFVKLSPDAKEVWLTHKTVDQVSVVDAESLNVLKVVDVGARPNHVEFVRVGGRDLVYITIGKTNLPAAQRGGENLWVVDRGSREVVKRISTGGLEAHGIWATPDGRILYVGHEVSNDVAVVDTTIDRVVATIPVGKRPIDVVLKP
ncbi:MAG: hypothetical protein HY725_11455 [Candidatus Rokubacteria bacterium]|nr:hypothetical protein [Candidatus Rokubacteria bacterium]